MEDMTNVVETVTEVAADAAKVSKIDLKAVGVKVGIGAAIVAGINLVDDLTGKHLKKGLKKVGQKVKGFFKKDSKVDESVMTDPVVIEDEESDN